MTKKSVLKTVPLLLMIFTAGGVIGFLAEELSLYINDGVFVKRGITYGPWIPIWATGSLLIYFICVKFRRKPWLVFLVSAGVCGFLELLTGYILDEYFHKRLWDYRFIMFNWGNYKGYVCLRSVAVWGLCGLLLTFVILPVMEKIRAKHPQIFDVTSIVLSAIFVLDIICSLTIK